MKLSILDQSPVPEGLTPADALGHTIALARRADALGYERYWIAEHHGMAGLASTAPEILIARLGAETAFAVTLLVGVSLLFAGFLVATGAGAPAAPTPAHLAEHAPEHLAGQALR